MVELKKSEITAGAQNVVSNPGKGSPRMTVERTSNTSGWSIFFSLLADEESIKSFLSAAYRSQIEFNSENLLYDEIITMITGVSSRNSPSESSATTTHSWFILIIIFLRLVQGTDTTAITNSFFLLAVAANPHIQVRTFSSWIADRKVPNYSSENRSLYTELFTSVMQDRLYNEIREVFGNDDRPADADDISKLTYLDQVMKETLRRFVLVPVVFRQVEVDSKIGI